MKNLRLKKSRTVRVAAAAAAVAADRLVVNATHPEAANDRLEINTLAGRDAVDSSGLAAGAIQLLVDGIPVP